MFQALLFQIRESAFRVLTRVRVQLEELQDTQQLANENDSATPLETQAQPLSREFRHKEQGGQLSYSGGSNTVDATPKPVKAAPRIGRNDPCPCGSGKKYKKCCGRDA